MKPTRADAPQYNCITPPVTVYPPSALNLQQWHVAGQESDCSHQILRRPILPTGIKGVPMWLNSGLSSRIFLVLCTLLASAYRLGNLRGEEKVRAPWVCTLDWRNWRGFLHVPTQPPNSPPDAWRPPSRRCRRLWLRNHSCSQSSRRSIRRLATPVANS